MSYWKQAKITARYKNVACTVIFFISLSLYGALAFLVNIPFSFNNLIYFISERFFPKTREIGSLVVRSWEMTKNRDTHGRTVRVGRSVHAKLLCPCGRISWIIYLRGMRDRSMGSGTGSWREYKYRVIFTCTRFGRYLYSTKYSWIINIEYW